MQSPLPKLDYRILKFRQESFPKPYIERHTDL